MQAIEIERKHHNVATIGAVCGGLVLRYGSFLAHSVFCLFLQSAAAIFILQLKLTYN